ncbi:MAG TPA: hypothetical protein VNN07_14305 [Candidatus Tectomicrobia bacterium]|nr:hypothetical protein [Candidatus Tectomicrobia bacterium]
MSARRPRSSFLLALLVALAGAGCAIALPPPRQPVPEDARRAVDLLVTRWHAFEDLRALADVVVHRGNERQSFAAVVLARAPASVRVEALTPLGQPLLVATVHEGRVTAYNAGTNEATVGTATAEVTADLLGLPLEPEDLVATLAGTVVPPRDLRLAEIQPPDESGPSLLMVGGVHEKRVWMDLETGVVKQVRIAGGRVAATVAFLRDAGGRLTGLDLSAAERYVTGRVTYRQLETDVGVEPERFVLTLPKNAKIQPIR